MNATFWIDKLRADAQGLTTSQVEAIAQQMGLSHGTLAKIISGETRGAHSETVDKIVAHYMAQPLLVPPPQRRRRAPEAQH